MRFDRLVRGAVFATVALTIACSGTHAAYEAEKNVAGYGVSFDVDPLIIGERNEVTVTLRRDGHPLDRASVTLRLSMPKMNMPESVVTLRPQGGGHYREQLRFTMSGYWLARVVARTAGQNVRAQFDFSTRDH